MLENKNLLVIAYYFPPIKAIGSIRTYFLTKNLIKKDWNILLFTTGGYKFLQNDKLLNKLKKVQYKYLPTFDLQMIKRLFNRKNYIKKEENSVSFQKYTQKISFFKKLRNSFPLNIHYEGGIIYIFFGILYGIYYIKKNNIKYIYSTFSPISNHIVAYFLKLIYRNCYWVADFRDLPFGDSETVILFRALQNKINKIIFTKTDAIVVVSEGLKHILEKYNHNIEIITNGFEFENHNNEPGFCEKEKNFTITYTGALYGGKRDAEILFKSIQELKYENKIKDNIKLVYAGTDSSIWEMWASKYDIKECSDIRGELSLEDTKELQRNSTVNLMLTWATKKEKGMLTGKFYEYLSTMKPIVCLINGEKDPEIEEKFKSINCGYIFYENTIELKQVIEELYNKWEQNTLVNMYNKEELLKYTYNNLSMKLTNIYMSK